MAQVLAKGFAMRIIYSTRKGYTMINAFNDWLDKEMGEDGSHMGGCCKHDGEMDPKGGSMTIYR